MKLYRSTREVKDMTIKQVDTAANKLPYIENLYEQAKEETGKIQCKNKIC
jgi:hypothetical protein